MTARLRSHAFAAFHVERRNFIRLLAVWLFWPMAAPAAEPLRNLINRELAPPTGVAWPKANDAEFLRRVSLDLNGMPPSADEARAFLIDTDPAKREKLVDRLIGSPLYSRHVSTTIDIMLMERRPNTHVTQDEWQSWLLKSVRENKPWNTLVREILTADGATPESRAPARFYLDRNSEPHVITRDLGRMFFGRDMQCNQCHDSPLVADYLQRDYHGLLAIASTGYAVTKKIAEKDVTVLAERSPADLTFESVFDKGNAHRTVARLPGSPSLVEPLIFPGDDYSVAPADGVRAVPKFSRRTMMAELSTNGSNRAFNENIVNRLWAMMLGRGLVHPLDMMHPDNPAASPTLLKQLGEQFVAINFDIKQFLREVALSDVYQRPFDLSDEAINNLIATKAEYETLTSALAVLAAQARDAAAQSNEADAAFSVAEAAMLPIAGEMDAARTQLIDAKKKLDDAQKAVVDATSAFSIRKAFAETLQQATTPLQAAVAALPGDVELAATSKKLTERTALVVAELAPLQQSVTDKTAPLTALTEAHASARSSVDVVARKLEPSLQSLRAEETKTVAARTAMQEAQLKATSAKNRVAELQRLTTAADQKVVLSSATQTLSDCDAAFASASQQVSEYTTVVATRTQSINAVTQSLIEARKSLELTTNTVRQNTAAAAVLSEATVALRNAHDALPADESIAGTLVVLTAKATSAQAQVKTSDEALALATQMFSAANDAMTSARSAMDVATDELQRRHGIAMQCGNALNQSKEALAAAEVSFKKAMEPVPVDLASEFALSQLKPLSPEQMCWTVFKITTVYDRYAAQEAEELEKSSPLTEEQKKDPATAYSRTLEVEQRTFDKLKGNVGSYVQIYGGAPGQPQNDFYASPDQALFTANGSAINSWVVPAADNPTERITKATDSKLAAEELYLGVLTRMPTDQEIAEVTTFLNARPDKNKAAQELVWGLISSAEFRFNK